MFSISIEISFLGKSMMCPKDEVTIVSSLKNPQISNLFYKNQAKKFFYNDIKKTFLNEINYINGDFNILKKYCKKINELKIQNYNCSLYLNSLRY